MSGRVDGSRAKVERAIKHLDDLLAAIGTFDASVPYVVDTLRSPDTRCLVYYVASVRQVPIEIAVIAGDVLQCLRTALDYLAYQLVDMGTSGKGPFKGVYFPIADSVGEYQTIRPSQTKGMGQDALRAVDAVKPYKGGNDTLWRLHRLNRVEKHRLLITVGSAFRNVDIGGYFLANMEKSFGHSLGVSVPLFLRPADRLFPLKIGDELFVDLPDAEPSEKLVFEFEVALSETAVVDGEPLIETLRQMVDTVTNLVSTFEPLVV